MSLNITKFEQALNGISRCIQTKLLYDLYNSESTIEGNINVYIENEARKLFENKILQEYNLNVNDHATLIEIVLHIRDLVIANYNATEKDIFTMT